jgi:ATP-dependent RNA helicase DDX49/DBP8
MSSPGETFSSLGLVPFLCEACRALRMQRPTPIQRACIPAALNDRYHLVVGTAETGSGKTAAFVLPMLQLLARDPCGPFAVILTPTRELAFQITEQVLALGTRMGVRVETVVGGVDAVAQNSILERERPHMLVATPGRLAAFIRQQQEAQGPLSDQQRLPQHCCRYFQTLRFFVLDEADRLLEEGFAADLATILAALPSRRRTLLFSATMTRQIERIQQLFMASTEPSRIFSFDANKEASILGMYATVTSLRHSYLFVPAAIRDVYAAYVLLYVVGAGEEAILQMLRRRRRSREAQAEDSGPAAELLADDIESEAQVTTEQDGQPADTLTALQWRRSAALALVFTASCAQCAVLARLLDRIGLPVAALHGRLSQKQRIGALQQFKSGKSRVLVCTDLAARGLDIPQVQLVMNFDMPRDESVYVHRVGRTARAGRAGSALSLVTQYDIALVQSIETTCGIRMVEWDGPGIVKNERQVMRILGPVLKARRIARLELLERGVVSAEDLEVLNKINEPRRRKRTALEAR